MVFQACFALRLQDRYETIMKRPKLSRFDHTVPVPGLVDLAEPAFAADAFKNTKRRFGPQDAALALRSCWYRREFVIEGAVPGRSPA